ncbi:MAG TPA: hypothetical protein DCQ30_01450 [Acidimicrobiaceae bacterium]|nr:hypothetical protein [Acidimicrobiaceae bacterium]
MGVAGENLIPPWLIRPLVLWLLVMAAACGVWLGTHVDPMRYALEISASVATLAVGGLLGWHSHWRALPLLGVAPPVVLLVAGIGLILSDPSVGAAGFVAVYSVPAVFVMATVVYPLSLTILGVGALTGAACQRLAGAK